MKCFAKIVFGSIQSTTLAKNYKNYLDTFSIVINLGFHFKSFGNFSNLINNLFKFVEQKFSS